MGKVANTEVNSATETQHGYQRALPTQTENHAFPHQPLAPQVLTGFFHLPEIYLLGG